MLKFFFKNFLFLLFLLILNDYAYSLTDYRIKEICKNKPRRSKCINNLKHKKLNLKQGNRIEIPVIPFKE